MTRSFLPFASIIVPVLNGERTIRECLASLLKMDYPPERREILVVDNGSTDRTEAIVQSYPAALVREKREGAAAARNRGIETSRGAILAFTDADCVVTTRWLSELVQGFEDPAMAAVEGRTIAYLPTSPAELFAAVRGSHSVHRSPEHFLFPYVNTCNVAFRQEVFSRIGLFDTRFPSAGGEDVDFGWRFFREKDLKLLHNPKAVVFHRHRKTAWGYFRQQMRYGRGLAILQAKYPEKLSWGWQQEFRAWAVLPAFAWAAGRAAMKSGLQRGKQKDFYELYFTFLRKFAVRLGFVWRALEGRRQ
ncbi:MAG: glycosyltransferase [Deltaproteobacteria bacterium]|nr:glycosyltransferase [Deltaproteobacteria bacterium]